MNRSTTASRRTARWRLPRTFALAVLAAALLAVLTPGAVSAAPSTPYGVNLLYNPKAEAAVVGAQIPHWGSGGGFQARHYGDPGGFPTVAEGKRIHGGHKFFAGGPSGGGCSSVDQTVQIDNRDKAIDSGHVEMDLSALAATYGHDTDVALIVVWFVDANNVTSTITLSAAKTNARFVHLAAQVTLPWHTRQLTVLLATDHPQGTYCDAYFDNISLTIRHIN